MVRKIRKLARVLEQFFNSSEKWSAMRGRLDWLSETLHFDGTHIIIQAFNFENHPHFFFTVVTILIYRTQLHHHHCTKLPHREHHDAPCFEFDKLPATVQ
jgi:hypothetical protein